jgi:multidrug efflux pump subunit AcrB
MIPVAGGVANVPLRQVAKITPTLTNGQIVRRNGVPTITVQADVERGVNIFNETARCAT